MKTCRQVNSSFRGRGDPQGDPSPPTNKISSTVNARMYKTLESLGIATRMRANENRLDSDRVASRYRFIRSFAISDRMVESGNAIICREKEKNDRIL